jgi:hypothetical protein
MFFVAAVLVSFALLNVAESACAGSKSAELINVGFASSSAVFIDTNVPPGTVVRVQATEDDDDSTIYVEASGHDDITVTLKDGNAPGQVSLVVASAKSSAQPLASTTTLANAFGTGTITFDNGNGSNNNPTAGTTASLVDSQTSSGSTLRALAPLVSVLSAAMSCFGVAKADEVCPLTVVVKYSFKSAPNVRFVNLNDKSALVCALGSVSKLPASTITGVTLKANPFTWAPTDGYCLPTSFFQKTTTFGTCTIAAADEIAVVVARTSPAKIYVNGKLSSALDSKCKGAMCGTAFTVDGVDGAITAFTSTISEARFAVEIFKASTNVTCNLVYSCTGGLCIDGYSFGPRLFCGMQSTKPAAPAAPVSVCANPPAVPSGSAADAALTYCRLECGASSGTDNKCDANIRGECCGSHNVTTSCYSTTRTPPPVTCSAAWGTDCVSTGCEVQCTLEGGCPATGGACTDTYLCGRRCSCFPPYCKGAFDNALASAGNRVAATSAAIFAIMQMIHLN